MREEKTRTCGQRQLEIAVNAKAPPPALVEAENFAAVEEVEVELLTNSPAVKGDAAELSTEEEEKPRDPHDHDVMTMTEALGIVTRIAVYFPNWLRNLGEDDLARTMVAWAEELAPLGNREEVWYEVRDFLRKAATGWPPGIFETRRYVASVLYHKRNRPVVRPREELSENSRRIMQENLAQIYRMLRENEEKGRGKQNR